MVFSSSIFLFIFLPFALLGYYLLKNDYRNTFLLLISLLFYAWGEPKFVFIMLASIAANYFFGFAIAFAKPKGKMLSRLTLFLAITVNLGLLFYYKYFDFAITSLNNISGMHIPLRNIALPIGISFFTFQGMSYIIDLYKGTVKVQKNLLNIALYITMFPQLMAGPIVRYSDINEQIDSRIYSVDRFAQGVYRFVIGLSKKVIIANQTGLVADRIFSVPAMQNSASIAWLGIVCYSFQIYFDFSGYSDMAIGLGKMFGFDFLENFNYPYISKSITEFWRRWHISLSSWFRDYVYIPLGGNRTGNVYVNLLIVFLLTGMWHGAAWNFIIWGMWHGFFLIIERIFRKINFKHSVPGELKHLYTLLVVIFGWVLFRSPSLTHSIQYSKIMLGWVNPQNAGFTLSWYLSYKTVFVLIIAVLASVPWKSIIPDSIKSSMNSTLVLVLKNSAVVVMLAISIMMIMTSTYNPFIYFRF